MEEEEFGDVSEGSDDAEIWADCGGGGDDEAARFARLQHEISRLNLLMYAAEDRTAHCSHLYEKFTSEMRVPTPPPQPEEDQSAECPLSPTVPITPPTTPPHQTPAAACARKCDIPHLDRAFLLWRRLERMRLAVSSLRLQVKQRQLDTLMQVNEFLIGTESGKAAVAARSETSVRQDIALNSFRVALLECSLLSSTASSLAASVKAQQQVPEKIDNGPTGWSSTELNGDSIYEQEIKASPVSSNTVDRATSPRPSISPAAASLSKRPYFNWPVSRTARSTIDLVPNAASARLCHSDSLVA